MSDPERRSSGLLGDISEHLAGVFRHMLPGVLVVGVAKLAYPDLVAIPSLDSWERVFVLAVITTAVGNTWFALNRYGLHQVIDYLLYHLKSNGPARQTRIQDFAYLDDLGRYSFKSLHKAESSRNAADHVRFRAATVLLALTLGELLALALFFHSDASIFHGHPVRTGIGAAIALAVGFWQMIITRRIDFYIVNPHAV